MTFNSLIAACAQGAQWEKAAELFEAMQARGCRPDPVTYGGLIAAYEKVSPVFEVPGFKNHKPLEHMRSGRGAQLCGVSPVSYR